jgi:putative transposase
MRDFRRERHSISRLVVHLVCVTKYRREVLDAEALDWLREHARRVFGAMGCELLGCDGEADYLQLLVEYPPKHSIAVLVNAFKGTSSRLLRKHRPDIGQRYCDCALWSPSYFEASTGGAPLEEVKRYIQGQRASAAP